ncbi:MAG: DUF445 domain-containing protein [Pseudomonadota bacterium]
MLEPSDQDALKLKRLRTMKLIATGMLVLMAVIFVFALRLEPQYGWLGYVKAFAEAAMVGALADWFAVTALFKHPMGLPIPHTAIIPKRKDEIGESLARFIEKHFLTEDAFLPRVRNVNFGHKIGSWLEKPRNAERLGDDGRALFVWILNSVDNDALRKFMRENLSMTLRQVEIAPVLGRLLSLLTAENHHQGIVDALVRAARRQLRANKYKIRAKIDDESPWWLPGFVDREIYDKIVHEVENLIQRIGDDDNHEARQKFNEAIEKLVGSLKTDPKLIARAEELKNELLSHPAVEKYLSNLWEHIQLHLLGELEEDDSNLNKKIRSGVTRLGLALQENPEMQIQVNNWAVSSLSHLIENYRTEISGIVADTVKRWDGKATSDRVEIAVGRDLQFIRINGTLVGGIVGVTIYTLVKVFG